MLRPVTSHKVIAFLVVALTLAACSPSPDAIRAAILETQAAWTPVPPQTPFPTYTPFPTHTALPTYTPPPTIAIVVTRIVIVTPTASPTPLYTPTITPTPTKTGTPTKKTNATQTAQAVALAKMRSDKGDGFYRVNVDIAPGVWQSTGTGDGCYWARTTKTGNIIDNHLGAAGGTAYIAPTDFQVEFTKCGKWVFLSPP